MADQRARQVTAEVKRVRERIERWRKARVPGGSMPGGLWAAAVALGRRNGVYPTAQALGVDFGALRRRLAERDAREDAGGRDPGGFVELRGAQLLGVNAAAGSMVEVSDRTGLRLTIRLTSNAPLDVAGLVACFCERCS
jgi:hypothetical protein